MPPSSPDAIVVIAAHPDDETIGLGASLAKLGVDRVVHVTDGAPRDGHFASPWAPPERRAYAELRARETDHALSLAGLGAGRRECLGIADLEAARHLAPLIELLADRMRRVTGAVVTHAFEGGHPDHDAIAFAVSAAAALLDRRRQPRPAIWEMALYHGARGHLACNEFLPAPGPELELRLEPSDLVRKHAMLDAHRSQAAVLAPFFGAQVERLRPAPRRDFWRRPHDGPLWYEQSGLPWSFEDLCACMAAAAREHGLQPETAAAGAP